MANTLIKILIALLVFINLYSPMVKADSKNLKQCFYLLSESQNSQSLSEDLTVLRDEKIPVFVVIDPYDNISNNAVKVLEDFQREDALGILLETDKNLEKSYFAIKGYDKKLKISGLCEIQKNKIIYTGEKEVSFKLIEDSEPLKIISKINDAKKDDANYALVATSDNFNISTLIFGYNELQGSPLEVSNYNFELKEQPFIFEIFTYVGNMTKVLFSISIVILIVATLIFKEWSREKFLG